jgi:tRNA nucleotidyltransferase/poly(A) polymerase
MNKGLVWALFITITLMQMQGNMYYAFKNIQDYQSWSELFNLIEEEVIYQKRVLALVSGAILPLVALGFIKSLVDYIKPEEEKEEGDLEAPSDSVFDNVEGMRKVVDAHDSLVEEIENVKEKENWDEDHALDVVLNSMATDLEEEEEIAAWKETLNDGLDELEEVEEPEVEDIGLDNMIEVIEDQLRPKEEAIENLTETLTETAEDEDLLAKALREKAKVEMDDYLKSREDDQEVAN